MIFTGTMFRATKTARQHGINKGDEFELVVCEDSDLLQDESGEAFEVRVDPWGEQVVFMRGDNTMTFEKVE